MRRRERLDFWIWVLWWRRRSRPLLLRAVADQAGGAALHVLCNPRATASFLAKATTAAVDSARSTLKIRCAGPCPRRIIVDMFRQPFALSSAVAGAVEAALVPAPAPAAAAVTGARS